MDYLSEITLKPVQVDFHIAVILIQTAALKVGKTY